MIQQAECVPIVEPSDVMDPHDGSREQDLRLSAPAERDREPAERILERDAKTAVLRYGLEQGELRTQLRTHRRTTDIGHRALAFYLNDLHERGVHKLWGFSTALHYACRELEMSRRQARDLLAVGRALEELKRIDAAFADGRLSWTKARILCRIATPETEAAWLERALKLSSQQLEREVKGSEKGRPPRDDGKGLPAVRLNVSFKGVDPACHELYEQARRYVCAEVGEEVSPGDLLQRLCGSLLSRAQQGEKTDVDPGLYRVVIDSFSDGSFAVRSEEGSIPLDREVACALAADPRVPKVPATPEVPNTPLPHGRDKPIPPAMRQQVLARDGFRCVHCQRKLDLQGHHVIWLCHGGKTSPENLATLCRVCHGMVHDGYLRVSGTAPHALKFTSRDGRAIGPPDASELGIRVLTEPREGGAHAPPARPKEVGFADLPAGTEECAWLARHAHLFAWNERRRALEFTPGSSRDVPAKAPSPAASLETSSHRPPSLDAIVGQEQAVATLKLALEGARTRHQPLDHVLLEGPPGLGKTSIAGALARDLGCGLQTTSGPLLKDVSVLLHLLTSLQEGELLFIDEIHRLPPEVAEILYEAMEDGTLSVPVMCGIETRTLRLKLPPLTVAGATTDPDRLPRPLRDRFQIQLVLERYSEEELIQIIAAEAARTDLEIEPEAAGTLTQAALGTPRKALNVLHRAVDACLARTRHAAEDPTEERAPGLQPAAAPRDEVARTCQSREDEDRVAAPACPSDEAASEMARTRHRIISADAQRALEALGIDARGLDPRQRRALEVLRSRNGHPLGVARLAALLDVSTRIWRSLLEPALLRLNLITSTPRGIILSG